MIKDSLRITLVILSILGITIVPITSYLISNPNNCIILAEASTNNKTAGDEKQQKSKCIDEAQRKESKNIDNAEPAKSIDEAQKKESKNIDNAQPATCISEAQKKESKNIDNAQPVKNKAYFLKDNYDAKTKTYTQNVYEKYINTYRTVWRSNNPTREIKSSNTSIVKVRKVKNKNGYYDCQFAVVAVKGKATVTVIYKDGKKDIINVIVDNQSTKLKVKSGQSIKHSINNSGIYKIINVRGNIKVDKNIFSIVVTGKSSGIGDVIIIYNNGLIELIDVNIYKK